MSEPTPREEITEIIYGVDNAKKLTGVFKPDVEAVMKIIDREVLAVLRRLEKELDRPSPDTGYNKMKFAITHEKQRYGGKEQS